MSSRQLTTSLQTAERRWRQSRGRPRSTAAVGLWTASILLLSGAAVGQSTETLLQAINRNANLTILAALANTAGVSRLFADNSQNLTVFAPSDSAFRSALGYGSISCTLDYYSTAPCTSLSQLNAATDLSSTLLSLVVSGEFTTDTFSNGTRLQTLGSTVQQVVVLQGSQAWLGNAAIFSPNVQASNGILHLLTSWPTTDLSLNDSNVLVAGGLGDFGPFNSSQRAQIVASEGSLPTNVPSLISSYQRLRKVVELPQGGLTNPMSITYNPEAMYRLLRATPDGGFNDSEAVQPPPDTGAQPPPSNGSASPIVIGEGEAAAPAVAPASVTSTRTQAASESLPGFAESGVLGSRCSPSNGTWGYEIPDGVARPRSNETLAFMSVLELAALIQSQKVSSVELVEIFTERLKRYDYVLEAVVTYTTDYALRQARAADQLLAQGTYLGPLHGIPYGLKDIIAVQGYPTTWGAPQFRNQFINEDANVHLKLQAAGAVLIAKLATGEMAYDDVWWGGKTKNPWNIAIGSSGSSAGPTASVVAATVPFSVGSETEGSLMSPAQTCGATAMRPSLGSIGRSWVMTLSDSLDKLGPICRTVTDCAVIFDVLRGQDDMDPTSREAELIDPFEVDVSKLTVGYVRGMESTAPEVLDVLRDKGVTLKPFSLQYSLNAEDIIMNIMISEAAAHFDYWQRSHSDDQNRRQDYWPPLLRLARLIPAVEYIQAQRARSNLAVQVLGSMRAAGIDAFIANTTTELAMCNLVGIPTVSVPIGFNSIASGLENSSRREPNTVGFFGWPNGEPELLALGMAWQSETSYHLEQPPIDKVEASVLLQCQPMSRCSLPPGSLAPANAPSINISTDAGGTPVADSG